MNRGLTWLAAALVAAIPLAGAWPALAQPRVQGGGRAPAGRPLVVIDPGHGGRDPGAMAADGKTLEKDVTLAVARAIRDALVKSGRVRVALTREDDRLVPLADRPAIARRLGADLLVSIHADSAPNIKARGASAYTLSDTASDREAARLAAKENSAVRFGGARFADQPADVRSILADLAQREAMNESAAFARLLRQEAPESVLFRSVSHRFANFAVLRSGGVPAVLFETGYLSNAEDAAFLTSAAGRRALAQAARKAIEVHLARVTTRR